MNVVTANPEYGRVAQLRVTRRGEPFRGTGYRITDRAVLTAGHVVEHAHEVVVVFEPGGPDEWSSPARVELLDDQLDVAILVIDPPEERRGLAPSPFGQVGGRAAALPCRLVGFPWFKLRGGRYRDSAQLDGTIPTLSNQRDGTMEIVVRMDSRRLEDSPWAGMSGAAVWCAGRIVGVVSTHHLDEGANRLAATRISGCYTLPPTARDRMIELLGLPPTVDGLVDVIPAGPAQQRIAARRQEIMDLAPTELRDRERELAEIDAFCTGDDPYALWQAGPWSGKTALCSWLALHPPPGVTVLSFFVTRNESERSNSAAFTDSLLEQLTQLLDEPDLDPDRPDQPEGALRSPAAASRRTGHRGRPHAPAGRRRAGRGHRCAAGRSLEHRRPAPRRRSPSCGCWSPAATTPSCPMTCPPTTRCAAFDRWS